MFLRNVINTYWVRPCINVKLNPAPSYLVDRFKTVQYIHFWNTRSAINNKLYLPHPNLSLS